MSMDRFEQGFCAVFIAACIAIVLSVLSLCLGALGVLFFFG